MNVERLRELSDLIVSTESQFAIQNLLGQLVSDLSQITNNPSQPQFQTSFAQNLIRFRTAWSQMVQTFSPAQAKLLEEIKARPFFLDDIPLQLEKTIRDNTVTPAVIRDTVENIRLSREQYLTTLRELRDRLVTLGIEPYKLEPDTAEIGLLLPRQMFDNELDGLVKELRVLNRIIRAFSEVAIGHAERIEIHQISSTDPVFFFGLAPPTIALLARTVRWAIQTWKEVEEIRKIRAETQKLKSFSSEEVDTIFGQKIEKQISLAVDEKVDELVKVNDDAGRHHEQRSDLRWALESILGRVERGMTVEVRFLPPPTPKEGELPPANAMAYGELREVAPQLQFPKPDASPVLALPEPEPPSERLAK